MLSLIVTDLQERRKALLQREREHFCWPFAIGQLSSGNGGGWRGGRLTSQRRRGQLHPVKRGQPFLQRHGELVGEAPPVLVSHLVLESVEDLKSNTGSRVNSKTWL